MIPETVENSSGGGVISQESEDEQPAACSTETGWQPRSTSQTYESSFFLHLLMFRIIIT